MDTSFSKSHWWRPRRKRSRISSSSSRSNNVITMIGGSSSSTTATVPRKLNIIAVVVFALAIIGCYTNYSVGDGFSGGGIGIGVHARKLAILPHHRRRKPPPSISSRSYSLYGFPINTNNDATVATTAALESSIFLYRGGSLSPSSSSSSDNEEDGDESLILATTNDDDDSVNNNIIHEDDNQVQQFDNKDDGGDINDDDVQVSTTTASASTTLSNHDPESSSSAAAAAGATVEASTHHTTPPTTTTMRKKSNAVGDPDGGSSDDEHSDGDTEEEEEALLEEEEEEELMEELDALEKQLILQELQKERDAALGDGGGGGGGRQEFETLIEMAKRREGMKARVELMEEEIARRRRKDAAAADDDGVDDLAIDLEDDTAGDEEEDDLDDDGTSSSTTSYHMAGTNVTKEDDILKRQRKYKRGSIFKQQQQPKKRRTTTTSNAASENNKPTTPTTIDQTTLDSILLSAFSSMIYLPPPSPRLPSPTGSTSLKNVDISSRRRLDRRTLYHGLLAELGGSHHHNHGGGGGVSTTNNDNNNKNDDDKKSSSSNIDSMIRRRYLDVETSRSLKGALSLACQPKWRERLVASSSSSKSINAKDGTNNENGKVNGEDEEEADDDDDYEQGEDSSSLPTWFHRGGICLFPSNYDEEENALVFEHQPSSQEQQPMRQSFMGGNNMGNSDQGPPPGFFGPEMNNDDNSINNQQQQPQSWKCTMSMQETIAMALAHSLSCGLALIDDEALMGVREQVEESLDELAALAVVEAAARKRDSEEGEGGAEEAAVVPTINPEELRNSALLRHLVRLANEGKIGCGGDGRLEINNGQQPKQQQADDGCGDTASTTASTTAADGYGKISQRMKRDMELGLDDPNDELAVESLRLMKEDERHWFEPIVDNDNDDDVEDEEGEGGTSFPENNGGGGGGEQPTQQQQQQPLSLVLFLRSDTSPSILKSKSAVETLAQECVKKDGIHLLMLGGKGIDASTTSLSDVNNGFGGSGGGGVGAGMANGRMGRPSMFSNNRQQQQQQQGGGGMPFAFMSNFPPGSPEFNAQMMQQNKHQQQQQQLPQHQQQHQWGGQFNNSPPGAQFSANNANASGQNDPPGSKRFNIFLARTVNPAGQPQILGTIAPPQAGNLFPLILANMAKENLQKMDEEQQNGGAEFEEEENEQKEMFRRQMEELVRSAERHLQAQQQQGNNDSGSSNNNDNSAESANGMATNAAFFNATITSPFGAEIFHRMDNQHDNDNGEENGMGEYPTPPEHVQRAMQDAMSGVIERLAQMSASAAAAAANKQGNQQPGASGSSGSSIPMNIAHAFSQVLSNENLRRGIADNLSRAAPALIDPRCQGVMLSVYVPPGPDHPNKGMMPGDQYKKQQQQQQGDERRGQRESLVEKANVDNAGVAAASVPHGMGGWLNKILSSSSESRKQQQQQGEDNDAEDTISESSSTAAADSEDSVADASSIGSSISDDANEHELEKNQDKIRKKDSSEAELDVDGTTSSSSPTNNDNKPSKRSSNKKKSKREKNLDRARTLAVAAAALAGAKKNRKENHQGRAAAGSGGGGSSSSNSRLNIKLTPEQKAQRNLLRLQTLCRTIVPMSIHQPSIDPVRQRSWMGWNTREEGSILFRNNRSALLSQLRARNLSLDVQSGTKGAGIVLRQMMSVRDLSMEGGGRMFEDVIRCAVEIEAGKSQRHHESPWGVVKPGAGVEASNNKPLSPSLATDKSLVNFLHDYDGNTGETDSKSQMKSIQLIHPNSLESALSLVCGVSPSPGSHGSSSSGGSGVLASHRSKEDLMALAQDKHERALIPNCVSPQDIGVTYDMIGGLTNVKELLRQSITYPLKFPHLYSEGIAREAVKGVLLFGPPGTGKTMLAKAVATEGGASFLSVDASSVENKWLGESEKNAKAVFTLARRLAPCVIFIDEVDSLLSSREGSSDDSAHGTLTSVKTTMMSEWDGLNSGTNGKGDAGSDRVVVIGSTNRPFDLDEAVLRRFPRRILVDLPDLETRREILEVTLSENRLGADVNLTMIAERLEGYTGSDLKEVCREAVVQISHEQARMLDRGELLDDDDEEYLETAGSGFQMLRPVTMKDFENAMRKLKRSVSETGRELAKVWDWNDEYGEIKKTNKRDVLPQMMNMFL